MKRFAFSILFMFVLCAGVFAGDRELFIEAEGRYRSGNYPAALDLYTRLVNEYQMSSHVPDAQFRRALCYYSLGNYDEAMSLLDRVRARYSITSYRNMVPFWQGRILVEQKDYSRAAGYFDEYISSKPESLLEQAYLYRALCEQAEGRTATAAYTLELLLSNTEPSDPGWIYSRIASFRIKLGEYESVINLLTDEALQAAGEQWRTRLKMYLAEACLKTGRETEAAAIYSAAASEGGELAGLAYQRLLSVAENEQQVADIIADAEKTFHGRPDLLQDLWLRVGIFLFGTGDYEESEEYLMRVWDRSEPASMDGLVPLYLAAVLEKNGKPRRAAGILDTFLAESDAYRENLLVKAAALNAGDGKWGSADRLLDEFFRLYPESDLFASAAYLKSYTAFKGARYEQALEYIERAKQASWDGARQAGLLRLESALFRAVADYEKAEEALARYIRLRPDDADARLDLLKILYLRKEYGTLLEQGLELKWNPAIKSSRPDVEILSTYMTGLAAVATQDYRRAVTELSSINPAKAINAGLGDIYPYTVYYTGWSYYRSGDYSNALNSFARLVEDYPESPSAAESAYLAGWCAFLDGNYELSSSWFLKYGKISGEDAKGTFMYAKNLAASGKYREAARIFSDVASEYPDSGLADDAVFEKAGMHVLLNDTRQASADYLYLAENFGGPLAEEGLFRRGELYYSKKEYAEAREAYYRFRRSYPESSLFDAALYWGGMASIKSGEKYGAVLLWEKLINGYPDSSFRQEAMLESAGVYKSEMDYTSALAMYERCRAEYPDSAEAETASMEAEKLRLLLDGLSETEAELNVVIAREGGAAGPEGRRAMIALAAVYLSKGGEDLKPALSMLNQVLEYSEEDSAAAALAAYHIGEYYFRLHDFKKAAEFFISAAGTNPDDADLSAKSLYRAVEMTVAAGALADARKLVRRLKEFYPDSEWSEAAGRLVSGDN